MIPGKEGVGFHVIVWKLARQFSGQIQTVDMGGLIIIVSLMKTYIFLTINV